MLDLWRGAARSSSASLEQTPRAARPGSFYEGPPTANGMPGAHHVEARVFKDVFPRFKTMQGYHVDRKAGWDCHGLPVELAVEKELGFSGKKDIEAYGVAEFNASCRESVPRHVDAFERDDRADGLLGRPGRRLPDDGPGLRRVRLVVAQADLRQGPAGPRTTASRRTARAAAPACPTTSWPGLRDRRPTRRSTSASRSPPARWPAGAALLVWTTTPVDAGVQHRRGRAPRRHLRRGHRRHRDAGRRRAAARRRRSARAGRCRRRFTGAEMERWTYQRPFELVDFPGTRTTWCSPTTSPPRTAPAWCTSPPPSARTTWRSAGAYGLPVVNPVRPDGHFDDDVPLVGGQFFKHADADLVDDLRDARPAVPPRALRAQLPALLALPHRADLLRASRPGTSAPPRSRTRCCARTRRPTGTPRRSSAAATATG